MRTLELRCPDGRKWPCLSPGWLPPGFPLRMRHLPKVLHPPGFAAATLHPGTAPRGLWGPRTPGSDGSKRAASFSKAQPSWVCYTLTLPTQAGNERSEAEETPWAKGKLAWQGTPSTHNLFNTCYVPGPGLALRYEGLTLNMLNVEEGGKTYKGRSGIDVTTDVIRWQPYPPSIAGDLHSPSTGHACPVLHWHWGTRPHFIGGEMEAQKVLYFAPGWWLMLRLNPCL